MAERRVETLEQPATPGRGLAARLRVGAGAVSGALATAGRTTRHALGPVPGAIASTLRHRVTRRVAAGLAMFVVTLAGMVLGLLLGGQTTQDVGPFVAQFSVTPSFTGGTQVQIPPLGSLSLASHDGPAHLTVRLNSLDQRRTLALAHDPNGIQQASRDAVGDVRQGVIRVGLHAAGAALLGAIVVAAVAFRNMRRVAICAGLALATLVAGGGIALATFSPQSIEEPRYTGLLANAPAVVGDARRIAGRFGAYQSELQRLIDNVSRLYGTLSSLPVYAPAAGTIRVLHVSDLHLNPAAWSVIETTVKQFQINMVIDTGDINDWGTAMESGFVDKIGKLDVPYIFIRGNHDSTSTAAAVAREHNAIVLENRVVTVNGLTIAGIGDPRFTPDKQTVGGDPNSAHQAMELVYGAGDTLATTIRDYNAHHSGAEVNMALVHDPASAGSFDGEVPLVLAGHLHHREVYPLPPIAGAEQTTVMVEGSTGGAGLRGLEGETPTPLELSVLYFDPQHVLAAYDDITLGGTGQSQVTLERHVARNGQPEPSVSPSPP